MKKLNIPSAMVGLTFGLIATAFVYLFVPPPSTASADTCFCPSATEIRNAVHAYMPCATVSDVEEIVYHYHAISRVSPPIWFKGG